ncbi:unnamed protein product [Adineta steineri]|uniref:G-protein coupled receptors family 1 profile domain-containing protein n=1 Tax=Adineta steineri TaxID=433720 RepID=A0A818LN22_9BILA|nr:unnamed protein product [Adineta steineri]CAF3575178.1 unnamed protein product [Adineta steineri]
MNTIKLFPTNETIFNKSSLHADTFVLFAGHLLIVFYCLIFILGFLGNSAVIFVAIRKRKYRNVTNCYVMNLAFADLLFLILSIPYTTYLGLVDSYPFGNIICRIYMYLAYVFLLATCHTLAAMSIDRYLYIVLPSSKLQWRTSNTAFSVCLIIWASSLGLIVPYHITSHVMSSNLKTCGVNDQKNFLVCFLVFCSYYAVPLLIIIVCYTKLAMHVMQSNRTIVNQMNSKNIPKFLKKKQRRVTKMVIVVTLVFAMCWLPIHTLELMKCANSTILYNLAQSYPKFIYTIRAFAHALAYFNSCLNPYLYALLNRNFCFDLIDIIPTCFNCCKQKEVFELRTSNPFTKAVSTTAISNRNLHKKPFDNDDDEEDDDDTYYHDTDKQTNVDVSCQVELLLL